MSEPSQEGQRYERPEKQWECGLEGSGCPCTTGPTEKGTCPAAPECRPTREGDQWLCNRSEQRGGVCEEGPTQEGACCYVKKCRPRRTLRALRGRWVRSGLAFTVGALLMLLGASSRNELLRPGPLTSHHAQLLGGADQNRCSACHPAAEQSAAGLFGNAVLDSEATVSQSSLCLECHQQLKLGEAEPMLAHGLPAGWLKASGRGGARLVSALLGGSRGTSHADALACAVCHQEHHGANHDLAAMTDARCQSCHADQYNSFAEDHPEFTLWPSQRRTRIAFNHASHAEQHFTKANEPFDCRSCHQADAQGDLTVRPSYQLACGRCHEEDVQRSFLEGVAVLSLPTIDTEALPNTAARLSDWPAAATGDFDGELPAIAKLLISADRKSAMALQSLGADASFFDIDPGDPQQVKAAGELIASLRGLIDDLQDEGHTAIERRLDALLGEAPELPEYVAALPPELIDRLQADWFGPGGSIKPSDGTNDRRAGGGWSVDNRTLSLRYRPSGHDDPFLRAWLDAIVSLPAEQSELRDACLAEFARAGAPGRCLECHTVERSGADSLVINWHGRDRGQEPRGFTRFSHRPHTNQPELSDCSACHRIDPSAELSAAAPGLDPYHHTSEFVAITKSDCTDCHRPHAASDRCTQCHNYHVDVNRLPVR